MYESTLNIKKQNQERIIHLLREHPGITKLEISNALQLSMPTTLQYVNELLKNKILKECGMNESTGGRRAVRLQLNGKYGYYIGLDINTRSVELTAVNMRGQIIDMELVDIRFQDTLEVYERIADTLRLFAEKNRIVNKVLGVVISVPGIVDMETNQIIRSHIFKLEYVSLERLIRRIDYPTVVVNDANCASYAEQITGRQDYLYLSLNKTVGGAIIRKGQLVTGEHFQAGEVGHMILIPDGKRCYCGKQGCADAYLSPKALVGEQGSLRNFFELLEKKDETAMEKWNEYLEYLAILVTNLRMLLDSDIIIGGEVGACIEPYLNDLCMKAGKYDLFAREIDYLIPCVQKVSACSVGAAFLAADLFESRILELK